MGANTDQERTPAATHTFALTHGQVAMALRIGGGDAATETAADRPMAVRTHRAGACVSAAMVVAAAMLLAHATENHESRGFASSARRGGGSIPRASGAPGHENTTSTSQEQSKMLSKITNVTAAAAVGMAATVAGAQSAVQWKVSDGGNGHWYGVDTTVRSWIDANEAAVLLGAHLATITNSAENQHCIDRALASGSADFWLGAKRSSPGGQFAWTTSEPWNYEAWLPGQPDDYRGDSCYPQGEPWLELAVRPPLPIGWNDEGHSCGSGNMSILEWEADCNNDGIVDYGQCLDGTLPDYNGNNIPDCCERGEACVVGKFPVQWKVSDGGNGHWYMLDLSRRPWTGAADRASALGGHLVTVNSYAEHVFLRSSVFTYCCSMSDTWMGATRSSTDEEYHWVTGEQFVPLPEIYFNNNSAGWDAPALYLEQVIRFSWVGEWGGESNSANEGNFSVVEWSADCNNDGIVDYGQILTGQLSDANSNGVPDMCEFVDCNHDGIADSEQVARGQLPDYDGNNIPDCCDHGEACVMGSYPVQWRTASGGNGHWYQSLYVGPDPTHSEAVAVASSRGAYLATMNAQEEQAFCVKILQHSRAAEVVGGAWFGLVQDRFSPVYSEPSGGWVWGDGPVLFTNWASGEPSNDCFGAAEDFANIRPDGRWNDLNERPNCAGTLPGGVVNSVLLEWSADCNNDGTVDYGQILRGELPDINHNGTPDTCECIGDIYVDRAINGADLGALLAYWGPTTSAAASRACDLNGDGVVNGSDLGILLAYWGPCSN